MVRLLVVGPPHEAAHTEDAAVLADVADLGERLPRAETLGHDLGLREAVLGRALDRARVAEHQPAEADDGHDRLGVDEPEPDLLAQRDLLGRRGCSGSLHRPDEQADEEEHQRVATARLAPLLAQLWLWHRRQLRHIVPGPAAVARVVLELIASHASRAVDKPAHLRVAASLAAGTKGAC